MFSITVVSQPSVPVYKRSLFHSVVQLFSHLPFWSQWLNPMLGDGVTTLESHQLRQHKFKVNIITKQSRNHKENTCHMLILTDAYREKRYSKSKIFFKGNVIFIAIPTIFETTYLLQASDKGRFRLAGSEGPLCLGFSPPRLLCSRWMEANIIVPKEWLHMAESAKGLWKILVKASIHNSRFCSEEDCLPIRQTKW